MANMGSSSGVGGTNTVVPKFVIPITGKDMNLRQLVLPRSFARHYGAMIPDKVNLFFPNGDTFDCRYCRDGNCLLGIVKIFQKYNVQSYNLLCFDYVMFSGFYVTIIGNDAVEIEFPKESAYFTYKEEHLGYSESVGLNKDGVGVDLQNDINATLVEFNANCGPEPQVMFVICGTEVRVSYPETELANRRNFPSSIWYDGCTLYIGVRNQGRQIIIRKSGNVAIFSTGWKEFVSEFGLQFGYLIILSEQGNPFHFQVAIFKNYQRPWLNVSKGSSGPSLFVRFVNKTLLLEFEMPVPRVFWDRYKNLMGSVVQWTVVGGKNYNSYYMAEEHKFVGLHNFVQENQIQKVSMLVFRYVGMSHLYVTIIGKGRVASTIPVPV